MLVLHFTTRVPSSLGFPSSSFLRFSSYKTNHCRSQIHNCQISELLQKLVFCFEEILPSVEKSKMNKGRLNRREKSSTGLENVNNTCGISIIEQEVLQPRSHQFRKPRETNK